ncbi:MAG: PEGA domain-containing protein, partial [Candidatus Cloacimonadales bacterium]
MLKKIVLIIFSLLWVSLAAQLNQMQIVGTAEKTNNIVPAQYRTVNGERAACLIFTTDLDGDLDFKPNNELVAQVQQGAGEIGVYVQPDERVLRAYAIGYEPLIIVLRDQGIARLQSGDVWKLRISGDKPKDYSLVVLSTPADAEKWLDGELLGTGESFDISEGEHTLQIMKLGFSTITHDFTTTEKVTTIKDIKLTPAMPAAVTIQTNPEGAMVYIDNIKFGETPKSSFFEPGRYPLRIEKENYATIEEEITITEPETSKSYTLTDIRASLTVKTHPNATVKFNGESHKGGVVDYKIAPQVLQIGISMPKADEIRRVVTLAAKGSETIEAYPEVQTGIIQILAIPTTAKIELNGDGGEYYTATARKNFMDVPIGEYELTVKAEGYKMHQETFTLRADETISKQITLEEGSDVPENMVFVQGGTFQMGSNNGNS